MAQSSSLIVVNMDGRDSNKYKIHRESVSKKNYSYKKILKNSFR